MKRAIIFLFVAGCGAEHPPLAALPLRETLLADPRDVAALPVGDRAVLRARFVRELTMARAAVDAHEERGLDVVYAHDTERERAGRDSALALEIGDRRVIEIAAAYDPDARANLEAPLRDDVSPEVAVLVTRALRGPAGALLAGYDQILLGERLPAAYVIDGDTVQANAAWLVAMADASDLASPPVLQSALTSTNLTSLSACASEISQTCAACSADNTCDAAAVLSDYPDGGAECRALSTSGAIAENVCIGLIASRPDVLECIQKNDDSCASGNPKTNAFGEKIRGRALCRKIFEGCALDPAYVVPITCDTCVNFCNNACRIDCTNPSCSWNNGPSCKGPSASCSSCGTRVCSATPAREASMPWWTLAWTLAPLWFLARRSRKR